MLKQGMALLLTVLSASTADNENLLIPLGLMAIALVLWFGSKGEE